MSSTRLLIKWFLIKKRVPQGVDECCRAHETFLQMEYSSSVEAVLLKYSSLLGSAPNIIIYLKLTIAVYSPNIILQHMLTLKAFYLKLTIAVYGLFNYFTVINQMAMNNKMGCNFRVVNTPFLCFGSRNSFHAQTTSEESTNFTDKAFKS